MKPLFTRSKTHTLGATNAESDLAKAGEILDSIEKGRARLVAAKSECEALKASNAQLKKKIKRWKDQSQQMEDHFKEQAKAQAEAQAKALAEAQAQAQAPNQEVKLPKIARHSASAPNLHSPAADQDSVQKTASVGKLQKAGAKGDSRPPREQQSKPKKPKKENVDMKRWHLQEEHREKLNNCVKAKQSVQDIEESKIKRLETERDGLLQKVEELKSYLTKTTYSPAFLEFSMAIKVAAHEVMEGRRTEQVAKNLKECELDSRRMRLALEGIYEDSEAIKERIASIEESRSGMGGKIDRRDIRDRMEKIWREREGKLEAALEKEKAARDHEVSQTQELLAYAETCKAELEATKKDLLERQGVTLTWKRGFEGLWRNVQDIRKEHESIKATVKHRLVTEMAELQQRSAALLALLSVILPLTDQLRDLVESPVGAYIQNRVDMSSPVIDMSKLQRQLLELDSLRKKCSELNFSETKIDTETH
eukprot:gnl/MRDRNA2_/MRDRNA2_89721_c0_seq1.p1 gnl/MRDRNA2_/MRDRNA2_89721_c0~~gnl/MRDRNA2_/MRDRNA2_89721_c0_seq1.p1  ORF type:complete len:480 (+),score=134.55 gnl/MRDRNA2_/MRDRNA2_89721_c0_seq1:177-1616(+)